MPLNLTEDSLRNLIAKHFDREVARVKKLKHTDHVHVAFADGTMGVYSPEEIEKWAEDEVMSERYENYVVLCRNGNAEGIRQWR